MKRLGSILAVTLCAVAALGQRLDNSLAGVRLGKQQAPLFDANKSLYLFTGGD